MLEDAIPLAVSDDVGFSFPDRQGSSGPDTAGFFIAQVDNLSRRIADGIVGPRRQAVLATIHRPGISGAALCNLKTKLFLIRDNVRPGCRCPLFGTKQNHIFASTLMESAEPIEES